MRETKFDQDVLPFRIEPSLNATPAVIAHRDWSDVIVVSAPVDGPLSPRQLFHVTSRPTVAGHRIPPLSLGGPILDRDPAAVRRGDRMDVFAVGADAFSDRLLHASGSDGGPWSALRDCGPTTGKITSGVAAVSWSPTRLDVVAVGDIGGRKGLLHWWSELDEGLSGPEFLPCGLADRTPAIVASGEGKLHAFAIDVDGRLWEFKVIDGVLAGPFEVTYGAGAGGVGAAAMPDGSINVVALTEDRGIRRLVHAHADPAGQWRVYRPTEPSRLVAHRPAVVAWPPAAGGWFVGVQHDRGTTWLEPEHGNFRGATWSHEWRERDRNHRSSWSDSGQASLRLNPAAGASQHIAVTALTGPKPETFLNEIHENPPLHVRTIDGRANGFRGQNPQTPESPEAIVNLTDWSWQITGTHRDAHWIVVRVSPGAEDVEMLTNQLHQAAGAAWTIDDGGGAWSAWYSPFDWLGSLPGTVFARLDTGLAHRFWKADGSRPEPGAPSAQIVIWGVIRGPEDIYGQYGVSLSAPIVMEIPPVGQTHTVSPIGNIKVGRTPRL